VLGLLVGWAKLSPFSYSFSFSPFSFLLFFLFLPTSCCYKASPCSPRRPPRRRLAMPTGSLAVPRLNALRTMLCVYLILLFCWKQGVASQQTAGEGAGVFGRFRFLNQRASSQGEDSLSCHTIDLRTSTIKVDADENDLRFCFRIISPIKTFTLQVTALLVFSY